MKKMPKFSFVLFTVLSLTFISSKCNTKPQNGRGVLQPKEINGIVTCPSPTNVHFYGELVGQNSTNWQMFWEGSGNSYEIQLFRKQAPNTPIWTWMVSAKQLNLGLLEGTPDEKPPLYSVKINAVCINQSDTFTSAIVVDDVIMK